MGFDLLLIATNANGMTVPSGAKCCICCDLLDDGVGLSGCNHNACYHCMKRMATISDKCPIDGQPFDVKRYYHLDDDIERWLSSVKLKCQWFDGFNCTATAVAIRNAHRHHEICPNNPKNKMSLEQVSAVKLVHQWMQNNDFSSPSTAADKTLMINNEKPTNGNEQYDGHKCDVCNGNHHHNEEMSESDPKCSTSATTGAAVQLVHPCRPSKTSANTCTCAPAIPRYGFKPTKRSIGRKFFSGDATPECDEDWRQKS